jgi:hypothetical protein
MKACGEEFFRTGLECWITIFKNAMENQPRELGAFGLQSVLVGGEGEDSAADARKNQEKNSRYREDFPAVNAFPLMPRENVDRGRDGEVGEHNQFANADKDAKSAAIHNPPDKIQASLDGKIGRENPTCPLCPIQTK